MTVAKSDMFDYVEICVLIVALIQAFLLKCVENADLGFLTKMRGERYTSFW